MIYTMYWGLLALVYGLMFFINDVNPPKSLTYTLACLVGGRGLVTLVAWFSTRSLSEVSALNGGGGALNGGSAWEERRGRLYVGARMLLKAA
jgi:uncharacterized membrane protein HdeD (DUF308 family)